jgi:hypothetical protein
MNARVMIEDETVERALAADKTCSRVMAKGLRPAAGDLVGVRLNLNLFKSQRVAVQTIHKGNQTGGHRKNKGFFNGAALWYQKAVVLRDVYFNVQQVGRQNIASGSVSKFPMASADGTLVDEADPTLDGVELRFDPKKVHLFVDPEMRPVRYAAECTVYGHRVYARGILCYYDDETAPAKAGGAPSAVTF